MTSLNGSGRPAMPEVLQHGDGLDILLVEELSARELEVLRLAAQGLRDAEIGVRLGIRYKTVKGHLTQVYQKLGAVNRTQAVIVAIRAGLMGAPASPLTAQEAMRLARYYLELAERLMRSVGREKLDGTKYKNK